MKKLTLAAASALTLALAMPMVAQAYGHKGGGERRLEQLDTNADGVIAKSEAEAAAVAGFAMVDANADGFLTHEELKAGHEAHRGEMKAKWDAKREADGKPPREPKGGKDPAKMEARKAKMQERAAEHFAAVDTNGDGKWSQVEFTTEKLAHFTKLDTDGDGNITEAEREVARAKMKEHRGKWRDKPAEQ